MKTRLHTFCAVTALLASATLLPADIITEATRTFTVNQTINDPQDPPQVFLQTISDSSISSITEVDIGLNLVGTPAGNGFASDMFVSLNQNLSLTSILLNGVGMSDSDPVGYSYDGWNVTFSDTAAGGDIHLVNTGDGTGILTGAYQPDGRTSSTDTTRPSLLDVFNGSTGNGDWRLAVGDLSAGGQMELESWSLTLTGVADVPEPSSVALLGAGYLGWMAWRWRRKAGKICPSIE
jgi:hypothetical protein